MVRLATIGHASATRPTYSRPSPSRTTDLPPPLKWAGGKRWQLPVLKPLWKGNEHRRLVEPFCGGLAVTLGLAPRKALLNDINVHVINLYRWIQRGLEISVPLRNDRDVYTRHRDRFNRLIAQGRAETREAASLFYYLNRTGFNGLCRFNRKGGFNVPFGTHKTISYRTDFSPYEEQFASYQFANTDFENLDIRPSDFIYADPPYDVEFTQYSPGGFEWDDQVRVAKWLAEHPGPVVLANQATPRIVDLYKSLGFTVQFLQAPRMIACNGNRQKAREVLALRNI